MDPVVLPVTLPLLPLRNQVLLPTAFARIHLPKNSKKSRALVESFWATNVSELFVVAAPIVKNGDDVGQEQVVDVGHIPFSHLSQVATAARVLQVSKLVQADEWVVLLEGVCRVTLDSLAHRSPDAFDTVAVQQLERSPVAGPSSSKPEQRGMPKAPDAQLVDLGQQLKASTKALLQGLARGMKLPPSRKLMDMLERVTPAQAADVVAAALAVSVQDRLAVLQAVEPRTRLRLAQGLVSAAQEALQNSGGPALLPTKAGGPQLDASEPGGLVRPRRMARSVSDDTDEFDAMLQRLTAAQLPPEALKVAMKELQRLRAGGDHQPGAGTIRAYLELLADLPWAKFSAGAAGGQDAASAAGSLRAARQLLDGAHYGLDKLKDRVVEYLAVLRLRGPSSPAPVLCFIGPPGVGKTSIARSVAAVLGRPFVRIALGGVRDESEVRGHRRTYVGAMPGRIIQGVRRAGARDAVVLLDELDKLGRDAVRGDPAAALLEVLDPEQNSGFVDAFLGLPFDLSRVTFVATANKASDIPPALLDRLEVITVPGYTREEKVGIARRHLLPRLLEEHGLPPSSLDCPDTALDFVADKYTREAGVRNLSRCLAAICRHVAVSIVNMRDTAGPESASPQPPADYLEPFQDQEAAAGPRAVAAAAAGIPGSQTTAAAAATSGIPGDQTAAAAAAAANAAAAAARIAGSQCTAAASSPALARGEALTGSSASAGTGGSAAAAATPPPPSPVLSRMWLRHRPTSATSSAPSTATNSPAASPRDSGAAAHPAAPAGKHGTPSVASGQSTERAGRSTHHQAGCGQADVAGGTNGWGGVMGDAWARPTSHPTAASSAVESMALAAPGGQGPRAAAAWHSATPGMGPRSCQASTARGPNGSIPHGPPYPPDLLDMPASLGPPVVVTEQLVELVLGPPRFLANEAAERLSCPGNVAGLVWTAAGGSLQFVECCCVAVAAPERSGQLILTGQVGEVLQESAQIALSWVRSHIPELGLDRSPLLQLPCPSSAHQGARPLTSPPPPSGEPPTAQCLGVYNAAGRMLRREMAGGVDVEGEQDEGGWQGVLRRSNPGLRSISSPATAWDVHIHLPAGAIPKDGPSAGVTIAVALISLFTARCVRADTALTGELTLHGMVLPVGGIKEKLLAARHAGLRRVVVPARNMADVSADVPESVRDELEVLPARTLADVLSHMFDPPLLLLPRPRL